MRCLLTSLAVRAAPATTSVSRTVDTPMLRTGFKTRGLDPDTAIEDLNKSVPLGRIAQPEDIADVIVFLAGEDARYMCGALLEISGGKPVY